MRFFGNLPVSSKIEPSSSRTSSVARRAHVAQSDRQKSEQEMDHPDHPVKIADHQRRLVHTDDDYEGADDEGADGECPATAFGKGLTDADNRERADR